MNFELQQAWPLAMKRVVIVAMYKRQKALLAELEDISRQLAEIENWFDKNFAIIEEVHSAKKIK